MAYILIAILAVVVLFLFYVVHKLVVSVEILTDSIQHVFNIVDYNAKTLQELIEIKETKPAKKTTTKKKTTKKDTAA